MLNKPNDADVIVIGGGLGGLTAGATLAKQGKRVLLLEQHYIPGGCATTFKRKDYVMEVGLHEMDGLDPGDAKNAIFEYLDLQNRVELVQIPELFRLKRGTSDIVQPHGEARSLEELSNRFPEDAAALGNFYKLMAGVRREVTKIPTQSWKVKLLYPLFPLLFSNVVKASRSTLGEYLDANFKSEELKIALQANLLYYHDDPHTMSLIYFSLAQMSYIAGGGHFVKGGSQKLSNTLADLIRENGGVVLLGKMVTGIDVERGRATSVRFRDTFNRAAPETVVQTHEVIANAAIPLVADMLPPSDQKLIHSQLDGMQPACSLLTIYIGFNTDLKKLGSEHYSLFISPENVETLGQVAENMRDDFDKRGFVFVDYGRIDSGLAPHGKSFGCICTTDYLSDWADLDDDAYSAKKEDVTRKLFARLEQHLPGITQHIEHYDVGTARTVKRYTMNPNGSPYGFAQIPSQSGLGRPKQRSHIKNLRFASAWSNPGGGFSGAIVSGFLAALDLAGGKLVPSEKKPDVSDIYLSSLEDSRRVRLLERRVVATDTIELVFEKPEFFDAAPGQYAVVAFDEPETPEIDLPHRSLSIVSHSTEDTLRFAMRRSDSWYKRYAETMTVGSPATIYGPTGDFLLPCDDRPIAFLVGGIGITPVIPMVRELQSRGFPVATALLYANRTKQAAAYHDELATIERANFQYSHFASFIDGHIDESKVRSVIAAPLDWQYYIVGTADFLASMRVVLATMGVSNEAITVDDFG